MSTALDPVLYFLFLLIVNPPCMWHWERQHYLLDHARQSAHSSRYEAVSRGMGCGCGFLRCRVRPFLSLCIVVLEYRSDKMLLVSVLGCTVYKYIGNAANSNIYNSK